MQQYTIQYTAYNTDHGWYDVHCIFEYQDRSYHFYSVNLTHKSGSFDAYSIKPNTYVRVFCAIYNVHCTIDEFKMIGHYNTNTGLLLRTIVK